MTTEQKLRESLNKNKSVVVIMRGLPGSGKSTFVQKFLDEGREYGLGVVSVSADKFWGETYAFDASRLGEAHAWCLRRFVHELSNSSVIFVDNTNLSKDDFDIYVKLAKAFGFKPVIVTFYISPEESKTRNLHNVPAGAISRMQEKMFYTDNKHLQNYTDKNGVLVLWENTSSS